MAMHDIEDLVEASARLVLQSDRPASAQHRLVHGLFGFQGAFDTHDTRARLADVIAAPEMFWSTEPAPIPWLELVATIMEVARDQGAPQWIQQWLAALIQALRDLDVGDALPGDFEALIASDHAKAIRTLARAHPAQRSQSRDALFPPVPWNSLKGSLTEWDEAKIEVRYRLRFFSDLSTEIDAIRADYATSREALAALRAQPLFRIPALVQELSGLSCVGQARRRATRSFVFALGEPAADPEGASAFLIIEHDQEVSFLRAQLAVQHGLLLGWQGRALSAAPKDMHFRLNLLAHLPEGAFAADPNLQAMGGWAYGIRQSERLLVKRLKSLVSHLGQADPFLRFHQHPLRARLEGTAPEEVEAQRRELRAAHGFFVNDLELMFAYACLAWDAGTPPAEWISRIQRRLPFVSDAYHLKRHWTEGMRRLETGPWFPPLDDTFAYRVMEADEEV